MKIKQQRIVLSNHAYRNLTREYKKLGLHPNKVVRLVNKYMLNREPGQHWVILTEFSKQIKYVRERDNGKDGLVRGNLVIAVVRCDPATNRPWQITTVFVRRNTQPKDADWVWDKHGLVENNP